MKIIGIEIFQITEITLSGKTLITWRVEVGPVVKTKEGEFLFIDEAFSIQTPAGKFYVQEDAVLEAEAYKESWDLAGIFTGREIKF